MMGIDAELFHQIGVCVEESWKRAMISGEEEKREDALILTFCV